MADNVKNVTSCLAGGIQREEIACRSACRPEFCLSLPSPNFAVTGARTMDRPDSPRERKTL
ncbi:hypothetical protein HMPREF0201_02252 [Cedecea davisae DSM 4568]|uniref:Uncharacterized protein n=1 Tax=Cedecea davisae DSM 4568 TaxID=566551 RepID=S3JA50_9ENTR|nr:hypothetical protein HMPREF0201_02252 [Cedecea davisae DSM 4568]